MLNNLESNNLHHLCSQCKLVEQSICLACVQKEKNYLRLQLPKLRQQYSILEKRLQPGNWENSFTLFKHWRDVLIMKCRNEKQRILEIKGKINSLQGHSTYSVIDKPVLEFLNKNTNLMKVFEFKQKQCKELQLKLQEDVYFSLDSYSSFRNDTAYAYILGSIPSPVQLSVFQLPIEDLLGILGHSCLMLKVFERMFSVELQFDYVLRNSHTKVFVHKNFTALSFTKHSYEFHLFLPEIVLQYKVGERQDDAIDTKCIRSFIIALTLMIYEISKLYNIENLSEFMLNPFRYLLQPPQLVLSKNFKLSEILRLVVEELLKVPFFNNILEHLLRPSGYGLISDQSYESSHSSLEDYTVLNVAEDKPLSITDVWEDLKYHLRLLEPPFDILDQA